MRRSIYISLASLLLLAGCRRSSQSPLHGDKESQGEISTTLLQPSREDLEPYVRMLAMASREMRITGRVLDEFGLPLSNASVAYSAVLPEAGDAMTDKSDKKQPPSVLTDDTGHFAITLPQAAAVELVSIVKQGYTLLPAVNPPNWFAPEEEGVATFDESDSPIVMVSEEFFKGLYLHQKVINLPPDSRTLTFPESGVTNEPLCRLSLKLERRNERVPEIAIELLGGKVWPPELSAGPSVERLVMRLEDAKRSSVRRGLYGKPGLLCFFTSAQGVGGILFLQQRASVVDGQTSVYGTMWSNKISSRQMPNSAFSARNRVSESAVSSVDDKRSAAPEASIPNERQEAGKTLPTPPHQDKSFVLVEVEKTSLKITAHGEFLLTGVAPVDETSKTVLLSLSDGLDKKVLISGSSGQCFQLVLPAHYEKSATNRGFILNLNKGAKSLVKESDDLNFGWMNTATDTVENQVHVRIPRFPKKYYSIVLLSE